MDSATPASTTAAARNQRESEADELVEGLTLSYDVEGEEGDEQEALEDEQILLHEPTKESLERNTTTESNPAENEVPLVEISQDQI